MTAHDGPTLTHSQDLQLSDDLQFWRAGENYSSLKLAWAQLSDKFINDFRELVKLGIDKRLILW